MTKRIPLTQGKVALVDDEDYERLARWKWCAQNFNSKWYAARGTFKKGIGVRSVRMHREVMGVSGRVEIDHVNGNGLDNRRRNLRIATRSQNAANSGPQKPNTSGYKGVSWDKAHRKWHAQITVNGRTKGLGLFGTKEQAAQAYNKAAQELHGSFAWLNPIKLF